MELGIRPVFNMCSATVCQSYHYLPTGRKQASLFVLFGVPYTDDIDILDRLRRFCYPLNQQPDLCVKVKFRHRFAPPGHW